MPSVLLSLHHQMARQPGTATMTTLTANITLDENLKAFVESDVAESGCASVSEYMRNLIKKRQQDKLEYDAAIAKFRKLIPGIY